MKEIRITNEVMPVLEINFEEMKSALSATLENYREIVVTEEYLPECKATQKDLAGMRIKIDGYRKEKKKELSKPIEVFESQCKELIALIEKAEAPIKEGIRVFDDKKRAEKRATAERLIEEVSGEIGLNEKYSSMLDVSDKYCNLTAKESDVRDDLYLRASTLKVEQDREAELLDIINDSIAAENQRLKSKMDITDFKRLIALGVSTKEVLTEIKSRAQKIYDAENPPEPETPEEPEVAAPEIKEEQEPIEEEQEGPDVQQEEPTYFAVYRITGTYAELQAVSEFLKANKIVYSVTNQGEI